MKCFSSSPESVIVSLNVSLCWWGEEHEAAEGEILREHELNFLNEMRNNPGFVVFAADNDLIHYDISAVPSFTCALSYIRRACWIEWATKDESSSEYIFEQLNNWFIKMCMMFQLHTLSFWMTWNVAMNENRMSESERETEMSTSWLASFFVWMDVTTKYENLF